MTDKAVARRAAEVVERSVAFMARLRFVTPDGREETLESVDVFELNDDFKIVKGTAWWDPEPLMKLLQGP